MSKSFFKINGIFLLFFVFGIGSVSIKQVQYNSKCTDIYQFLKRNNVDSTINNSYQFDDSKIVKLTSDERLYDMIVKVLNLSTPKIKMLGFSKVEPSLLLKIYIEDIQYDGLFVIMFDSSCNYIDKLYLPEPINGDQLGFENDYTIEWYYNADFYLQNDTLMTYRLSVDVKSKQGDVDTLYKGCYISKYMCDCAKGFREFETDSVIIGKRW